MPLKMGHHWPASETPLIWRFAGVPKMAHHLMLAKGIQNNIARKPYIFVIFQGVPDPLPPPPSGSAPAK